MNDSGRLETACWVGTYGCVGIGAWFAEDLQPRTATRHAVTGAHGSGVSLQVLVYDHGVWDVAVRPTFGQCCLLFSGIYLPQVIDAPVARRASIDADWLPHEQGRKPDPNEKRGQGHTLHKTTFQQPSDAD